MAQGPPKRSTLKRSTVSAYPPQEGAEPSRRRAAVTTMGFNIQHAGGLDPRALRPLRGDHRIPGNASTYQIAWSLVEYSQSHQAKEHDMRHLKFRISSVEQQFQWNWFSTWNALAYDFFGGFGVHWKHFCEGLWLCGAGLGRHGQALEPLNRVLEAFWWRLEKFCRRLEAI